MRQRERHSGQSYGNTEDTGVSDVIIYGKDEQGSEDGGCIRASSVGRNAHTGGRSGGYPDSGQKT